MNVVDDFGRFHADHRLLRAACYPLRIDTVKNADIEKHLKECAKADLLMVYNTGTQQVVQLHNFRQRSRANDSKFTAYDGQMTVVCPSSARLDGDVVVCEDGDESEPQEAALTISGLLAESIVSWKPDYKGLCNGTKNATTKRWAKDVDKMLRLDKRDPEKVKAIIDWLPSHKGNGDFMWRNNVLSGSKLREQYDKLDMAMVSTKKYDPSELF